MYIDSVGHEAEKACGEMTDIYTIHGKLVLTLDEIIPTERREIYGEIHKVQHFKEVNLAARNLAKACFERHMLTSVNLRGAILNSANFGHAILENCNLNDCIAQGCNLDFIEVRGATCVGADFYWAIIFSSHWVDCNFENAKFQGAGIADSTFEYCNFTGANFSFDNLGGKTRLTKSKFLESDFTNADLSGIECEKCEFVGSAYTTGTKFPKGFDPQRHQMKLRR